MDFEGVKGEKDQGLKIKRALNMFGKLIAGKKINYPQLFYLLSDFDKMLMLLLVLMSYESLWCQGCISG